MLSPAKINLFLAVLGKRPDGYHDLVSLAAPLAFGDTLEATPADSFSVTCDDPAVPLDGTNLILKAALAFRAAANWPGGAQFRLQKRIPIGAGLGGGSSNAAAALLFLNEFAGHALSPDALSAVAAQVGSDCPLFLHQRPVVLRGRGERIEPLPPAAAARVRGRRVLLFMPSFGVSTPWAYGQWSHQDEPRTASVPSSSAPPPIGDKDAADSILAPWLASTAPAEKLLFNSLEAPVFEKYVALPALLTDLRRDFGFAAAMSGSGSCCFALLPPDVAPNRVQAAIAAIRSAYGPATFVQETTIA